MKTNVNKIAFYDHDGTLMDVPMPDTGRAIWRMKTGEEYPHKGWWGQPDSLNTEVFDIFPYPDVLAKLKKDISDPHTLTILLTNRIPKLQPMVMNLLQQHHIKLDGYSFKTDEKNKAERIKDFLLKYPNVTEVDVYDDQEDQMQILKQFQKEHPHLRINIYHAIDGETTLRVFE